jgi:hypothetical protein
VRRDALHTAENGMVALDYVPVDDEWRRVGLGLATATNVYGGGVPL